MFKWWHEPILPRSSIKWGYVVGFSAVWLTTKYYLQRSFIPAVAALDLLAILFGCIALAALQSMFAKEPAEPADKGKEPKAAADKPKRQPSKRKGKRHP